LVLDGVPVLEWEYNINVGGVQVKGFIDQAWLLPDGSIEIVDLKSGRMDPDSFQLGVYAWALVSSVVNVRSKINGAFIDVRGDAKTDAVKVARHTDLLALHTWDEVAYRVTTMDRAERAGIYAPRVSTFCAACPVKHACPAQKDA
jgi:putative RecB family exonuclease